MTPSQSITQEEKSTILISDEFFVEISIIKRPEAVRSGDRSHDGHLDMFSGACCSDLDKSDV